MKQVQYFDKEGNLQFSSYFYYTFMAKLFAKTVKLFGATRIEIVDTDMKEKTLADIFVEKYHDKFKKNLYDFQNEKNSRIKEYIITEIPEFTDENVKEVMETYLSAPVFEECDKRLREYITSIIPDAKIDYKNKEWDTTPEYAKHRYHDNVIWHFQDICKSMELEEEWVKIHGKLHTDEEAAKIATEKVMEICFGWHLQDNGALNEEHSFMASMLATSLGNDVKKDISEEVKQKAYDLCYGYFLGYLKYVDTLYKHDYQHMDDYRNWLKENIPSDNTERFNWEHIYGGLDCDYDPNYPWYLIFLNAGMKESAIRLICPWKTGISIRRLDNAVQYRTYSNIENL